MTNDCTHRWVIPPLGVQPLGVCKLCGAERVFTNETGVNSKTLPVSNRQRDKELAEWEARMFAARALTWEPSR